MQPHGNMPDGTTDDDLLSPPLMATHAAFNNVSSNQLGNCTVNKLYGSIHRLKLSLDSIEDEHVTHTHLDIVNVPDSFFNCIDNVQIL